MLVEIRIKNLGLINELSLSFRDGFNIITGETGAGKSMIVEAVNLLIGAKAERSRIRRGCEAAEVEGLFVANDGGESTLRRVIGVDGRSRSYIDGRLSTLRELVAHSARWIDLHGQHGHQALLMPQAQLEIVDRFGGPEVRQARADYETVLQERKEKASKLDVLKGSAGELAERRRFLEWRIRDLERANPVENEDKELEAEIDRQKNASHLLESVTAARRSLDGQAIDAVQAAVVRLERAAEKDQAILEILEPLRSASAELEDAASLARQYGEGLTEKTGTVDELQERLFFLKDLEKKYGLPLGELIVGLATDRAELADFDDSDTTIDKLTAEVEELDGRLGAAAGRLSEARRVAGEGFGEAVGEQLPELAFSGAQFEVASRPTGNGLFFGADGCDAVEFLFSGNIGEPPRPLAQVASGGELSRLMLAIRSVFGRLDSIPTVLFDEIDAGIGGKTAVTVGERLARLSRSHQIICVTHLASIAAFADHHLVVVKTQGNDRISIKAKTIEGDELLKELTRLGGTIDESVVSIAHARRLLDQAVAKKAT